MALNDLEMEILHEIPATGGELRPYAYAVWEGRDGLEMGPVRARRIDPDHGNVYQCSPFPGAWDGYVPESAIRRVRHVEAMSL